MDSLLPKKELEHQSKRVMHLAKKFIESNKCRRCGNKDRKAVDLHEFGDPYLPSQVNIYCPKCNESNVFAMRPSDEATALAKFEMTGEATELPGKPVETAEEMIEYAKLFNLTMLRDKLNPEQELSKDEDNKIIASAEEVKKYEQSKKK